MSILIASLALAAAPAAPVDHSQHSPAQQAQHQQQAAGHAQHKQGKHEGGSCCAEVNGKMECQMMKGHGGGKAGQADGQGHSGH